MKTLFEFTDKNGKKSARIFYIGSVIDQQNAVEKIKLKHGASVETMTMTTLKQ